MAEWSDEALERLLDAVLRADPDEKDDAKATAARRWIEAVNTWGGLGTWVYGICFDAQDLAEQLDAQSAHATV